MTTALLLPVLFGAAGLAVDYTSMSATRSALQDYADSAALAASAALANDGATEEKAKRLARSFFTDQFEAYHDTKAPEPEIAISAVTDGAGIKTFTTEVRARERVVLSPFMALLGYDVADVSVLSKTTSSMGMPTALSMFLVLDRSGSMAAATEAVKSQAACQRYSMDDIYGVQDEGVQQPCYYSRMDSLQIAASALLDMLAKADPDKRAVRTGAVAYDSNALQDTPMSWGTQNVRTYVNALAAGGDTSSTAAFATANARIGDSMETSTQRNRNGLKLRRAILFMTDGVNNYNSDDAKTLTLCDQAKANGIIVYTVAFSAAKQGQQLLASCASSSETAFYASNQKQLIEAFKDIGQSFLQQAPRVTR